MAVGSAQKQNQLLAADRILLPLRYPSVGAWGAALIDSQGQRIEVVGLVHREASHEQRAQHVQEMNTALDGLLQ
jgi:hypothetical protein